MNRKEAAAKCKVFPDEPIESEQEDEVQSHHFACLYFYYLNPSIFETVDIYVSSAQVRIFPYLIGRESAFADNLKWMACANKGLGLFDKHFPRLLHISVLNSPLLICSSFVCTHYVMSICVDPHKCMREVHACAHACGMCRLGHFLPERQ